MRLSQNDGEGHQKSYVKRHVRHSKFVDALRDKSRSTAHFKTFKSTNHVISTVGINKVCLSPFDTKSTFYLTEFPHSIMDTTDCVELCVEL